MADPVGNLQRLEGGHFLDYLEQSLVEVCEAVAAEDRDGSVSVTLKIHNTSPGSRLVTINAQITRKPPVPLAKGAHAYIVGGELSARDPRQSTFTLREVDGGVEIRQAEAPPAELRSAD